MEARDPLQTVRWEGAALLGVGAGNFGHLAEDAHSAAAPDGTRWHRAPHRSPSSAPQSGILPDRLGPSALPCARRAVEVGGTPRSARRRIVRGGITCPSDLRSLYSRFQNPDCGSKGRQRSLDVQRPEEVSRGGASYFTPRTVLTVSVAETAESFKRQPVSGVRTRWEPLSRRTG